MLNPKQLQAIADGLQDINENGWRRLMEFIRDRTEDANENATAEGESNRDWWAGHERFGRDLEKELNDLREGGWREWPETQGAAAPTKREREEEGEEDGENED